MAVALLLHFATLRKVSPLGAKNVRDGFCGNVEEDGAPVSRSVMVSSNPVMGVLLDSYFPSLCSQN